MADAGEETIADTTQGDPHDVVEAPCPRCEATIPAGRLVCPGCAYRRHFSQKQYDTLVRCTKAEDVGGWSSWRRAHPDEAVMLEAAGLPHAWLARADLRRANLDCANLQGAYLWNASLQGVGLSRANLEGANLRLANLEGASLHATRLAGAGVQLAAVDGHTRLWRCRYDGQTDFTGVGLASACVEPGLRTALERNVRRIGWEKWYGSTRLRRWVLRWPVQAFWWASDYGNSTGRIFLSLLLLSLVFAGVYYWSGLAAPPGPVTNLFEADGVAVPHLVVPLRAVYFSVVTMTTLGFGDVNAEPTSYLGHILLMVQVALGYVLLGALVTRFAIMVQGGTVPLVPEPGPESPPEAGNGNDEPG